MKKNIPIVIKDTKDIKNIFIQVNLKNSSTSVFSQFSAWENLALIMEALGVTAEKCLCEGIGKKKVYEEIKSYLVKVLSSYKIIDKDFH